MDGLYERQLQERIKLNEIQRIKGEAIAARDKWWIEKINLNEIAQYTNPKERYIPKSGDIVITQEAWQQIKKEVTDER